MRRVKANRARRVRGLPSWSSWSAKRRGDGEVEPPVRCHAALAVAEGEEREKAIAPPPPPGPETKFTPAELAKLEEQLKSGDLFARQAAARELSSSRLGTPTPALLAEMVSLADDEDETVRHAALTVLANHGTKEHVSLLIKALNDPDAGTRATIAKGLGRLKDPRAIEPLTNLLAQAKAISPTTGAPRERGC